MCVTFDRKFICCLFYSIYIYIGTSTYTRFTTTFVISSNFLLGGVVACLLRDIVASYIGRYPHSCPRISLDPVAKSGVLQDVIQQAPFIFYSSTRQRHTKRNPL
ncbi:hypothetical protein HDV63DRAFT_128524 [Trichoderma sp. SZMC 28014]